MSGLSRSQLVVYAAIAVAVLLVGVRWVRAGGPQAAAADGAGADASARAAAAAFTLERGGDDGLVVHVAGAVRRPDVYRFPAGSRVTDAIDRAGGPGAGAALDAINLAAPLADGQQVVVPSSAPGAAVGAEQSGPVSLGSATAEDLDAIEGIGPVTAADILEYRDEHGGVASVDQLDEISGIGPATMEALRDSLQP